MKNIIILGADGQLGQYLSKTLKIEYKITPYTYEDISITNYNNLNEMLIKVKPEVVINCAAYTNVVKAETDFEVANEVNNIAVENLAKLSVELDFKLIHISSNYVFTPGSDKPHIEKNIQNSKPVGIYSNTKRDGDLAIINNCKNYLILRASWLHGYGPQSFVRKLTMMNRDSYKVATDDISNWTTVGMIKDFILNHLDEVGEFNIGTVDAISRYELFKQYINEKGLDIKIEKGLMSDFGMDVKAVEGQIMDVSKYTSLVGEKIFKDEMKKYVEEEKTWKQ